MSTVKLTNITASQAVGYATTKTAFNDLQEVGYWPAYQYIQRVESITIYYTTNPNTINGIEITYTVSNSKKPVTTQRGSQIGTSETWDLSKNPTQYFVGFFGTEDTGSKPSLRTLGFLVYDTNTGLLSPAGTGALPSPDPSGHATTGFASVGEIAGFSGTTASNGDLDTLAIYKFQPGAGLSGI